MKNCFIIIHEIIILFLTNCIWIHENLLFFLFIMQFEYIYSHASVQRAPL